MSLYKTKSFYKFSQSREVNKCYTLMYNQNDIPAYARVPNSTNNNGNQNYSQIYQSKHKYPTTKP